MMTLHFVGEVHCSPIWMGGQASCVATFFCFIAVYPRGIPTAHGLHSVRAVWVVSSFLCASLQFCAYNSQNFLRHNICNLCQKVLIWGLRVSCVNIWLSVSRINQVSHLARSGYACYATCQQLSFFVTNHSQFSHKEANVMSSVAYSAPFM